MLERKGSCWRPSWAQHQHNDHKGNVFCPVRRRPGKRGRWCRVRFCFSALLNGAGVRGPPGCSVSPSAQQLVLSFCPWWLPSFGLLHFFSLCFPDVTSSIRPSSSSRWSTSTRFLFVSQLCFRTRGQVWNLSVLLLWVGQTTNSKNETLIDLKVKDFHSLQLKVWRVSVVLCVSNHSKRKIKTQR